MKVVATNNRSFVNIAVTAAGGIESLFESALLSGVSVHEVPEPGTELDIVLLPKSYSLKKELPVLMPVQKLICLDYQCVQDLTIQTAGSLEHIFEMALLNEISITEATLPGQKYKAEFEAPEKDIVNYYAIKNIRPATGIKAIFEMETLFANGLFDYGLFQ